MAKFLSPFAAATVLLTASYAASPVQASQAAEEFCSGFHDAVIAEIAANGPDSLQDYFASATFGALTNGAMMSVSVSDIEADTILANSAYPELAGTNNYRDFIDANGHAFAADLIAQFDAASSVAKTETYFPSTDGNLAAWTGVAKRTDHSGRTIQVVCWTAN